MGLSYIKIRMSGWMCGKTRKRIRSERFQEHLGLKSRGLKTRLRWFGHVQHMPATTPVRSFSMQVDGTKGKGKAEEDVDGSNNRSEEVQPIQEFGSG